MRMEKREFDQLGVYHQDPNPGLWRGRATAPELGPQYWYQSIECIRSGKLGDWQSKEEFQDFGIFDHF